MFSFHDACFYNKNCGMHDVCFIGPPFSRRSWKISRLLAHWHTKLNNWHVGTFLALKHVKMTSWHALCTWALGQVDHAGTYGTRFSKFVLPNNSLLLCKKFEQVSSITRNNLFRNLTCVQNQKLKLLNSIWNLFQGVQTKKITPNSLTSFCCLYT